MASYCGRPQGDSLTRFRPRVLAARARGDQFGPGEPLRDAKIALEEARVFDWRFQL